MILTLLHCSFIFLNVSVPLILISSFYINIVVEKHWHVATIHIFSVNGYAVSPLCIFFLLLFIGGNSVFSLYYLMVFCISHCL